MAINPSKAPVMEPAEIARETIKKMAMQRIAPTPDNYRRIYNEIARTPATENLEEALAKALKQLPRDKVENVKWLSSWEKMLISRDWKGLPSLMATEMEEDVTASKRWPAAIRELLRQWEARHAGLTQQRKKEAVERVLINFSNDPALPEKLQAMTRSWSEYKTIGGTTDVGEEQRVSEVSATEIDNSPQTAVPASPRIAAMQEANSAAQTMLIMSLQLGLLPRLEGYPELQAEASKLLKQTEKVQKPEEWQKLAKALKALFMRVELLGVEDTAIKHDLLELLKLLVDNISELVSDDQWLKGQIAAVQTILSSPLEKALIRSAEKSLKEVIYKQGSLKHSLAEAKHNFKHMVAVFIERLGDISDSTGSYHEKIENYHHQLSQTDDIAQINALVQSLMQDTRELQSNVLRSHEFLTEERARVLQTEEKIRQLELELMELSEKVRIDQLTGVMNRRGLDEAFIREMARAERGESQLSFALLDIDNFKQFNDQYGHDAGDAALQHLAQTIRDCLRPTDIVARFGGEEFVLILPETPMPEAVVVVARLQRELTKRFFLHKNERLLVTFSAGIALYKTGDLQETVFYRADQAMYLAKTTGKNRVLTEDDLAQSKSSGTS
jgi:diguanylate cyclase